MKIILITQNHEWYGNDDGGYRPGAEGRWKPKGGSYIEVGSFDVANPELLKMLVERATQFCEENNPHFRSEVIGHEVIGDTDLTPDEKDEMEYEGIIRYGRMYLHEGRVVSRHWYLEATKNTPPAGSYAATAALMASITPDFDWDSWKDEMKEK